MGAGRDYSHVHTHVYTHVHTQTLRDDGGKSRLLVHHCHATQESSVGSKAVLPQKQYWLDSCVGSKEWLSSVGSEVVGSRVVLLLK